jgi:hypothetical protein
LSLPTPAFLAARRFQQGFRRGSMFGIAPLIHHMADGAQKRGLERDAKSEESASTAF